MVHDALHKGGNSVGEPPLFQSNPDGFGAGVSGTLNPCYSETQSGAGNHGLLILSQLCYDMAVVYSSAISKTSILYESTSRYGIGSNISSQGLVVRWLSLYPLSGTMLHPYLLMYIEP